MKNIRKVRAGASATGFHSMDETHFERKKRVLVTKIAVRIESIHVTMTVIGMKTVHTSLSLYNHSKVTSCGAHLGAELENSETGGEKSKEE